VAATTVAKGMLILFRLEAVSGQPSEDLQAQEERFWFQKVKQPRHWHLPTTANSY
jgi:hypothetical protein